MAKKSYNVGCGKGKKVLKSRLKTHELEHRLLGELQTKRKRL